MNPQVNLVFVANGHDFAAVALDLRASGYLTRPLTAESVAEELASLRFPCGVGVMAGEAAGAGLLGVAGTAMPGVTANMGPAGLGTNTVQVAGFGESAGAGAVGTAAGVGTVSAAAGANAVGAGEAAGEAMNANAAGVAGANAAAPFAPHDAGQVAQVQPMPEDITFKPLVVEGKAPGEGGTDSNALVMKGQASPMRGTDVLLAGAGFGHAGLTCGGLATAGVGSAYTTQAGGGAAALGATSFAPQIQTAEGLFVRTFGDFEVFHNGVPVQFKYGLTKQLFAYLVDRLGAMVTNAQVSAILWPGEEPNAHASYLRMIKLDLARTMADLGCSNVLAKGRGRICCVPAAMNCDYFYYLRHAGQGGRLSGTGSYRGEYMTQYAWAKGTNASLAAL